MSRLLGRTSHAGRVRPQVFRRRDVMKFQWMFCVFALFTLSIPARAQFIDRPGTNAISVNGEAEIRVVPDEVILTLGVETFNKILKAAKNLNDEWRPEMGILRDY